MAIGTWLKNIFTYQANEDYSFLIDDSAVVSTENQTETAKETTISTDITSNLNFMNVKFNQMINSDVTIRQFHIFIAGRKYRAFIIYIDGMVDSEMVNQYLLKPLMFQHKWQNRQETKQQRKNFSVKPLENFNLQDYIYNSLLPQNSITVSTNFETTVSDINAGFCALFVDSIQVSYNLEMKGFKQRSIAEPQNEVVIRGAHEAFVENIRTNTSLIRRYVNNENLIIENLKVGKISKTSVGVCYLKNIANASLVAEVKYRIQNLDIDSLISSGQLEQLIQDNENVSYPQMIATERPDRASEYLFEGRVVLIVDGSPYLLVAPGVLVDFLTSAEDFNLKSIYSNLLKMIRFIALLIAIFLPGLYVAVTNYHQELLPSQLLFAIAMTRASIPFPVIVEIFMMEISFELLREAGLRSPSALGSTIGIIGALILGEAAVSANIVSPILIIIVALTGICTFAVPDFSFGFSLRIYRFAYMILGFLCGFLGISVAFFIQMIAFANLKSFGCSYYSPYIPNGNKNTNSSYFLKPIWRREFRSTFLKTKRPRTEKTISMKWRKNDR